MLIIGYISIIVCIVGLCMYLWARPANVKEVGKIMFFCGLLVSLLFWGGKAMHFGDGGAPSHQRD